MNIEYLFIWLMPAMFLIGGYCVGALWYLRKIQDLRITIIKLEHDTARLLMREPRTIEYIVSYYGPGEEKYDNKEQNKY